MTMRRSPGHLAATSVLALVCALAVASCGNFGESTDTGAGAMLSDFAKAIENQDPTATALLTSSPELAMKSYEATFEEMAAEKVDVDVQRAEEYSDGTATFEVKTTWILGDDREFQTTTEGSARKLTPGWRVQWEPGLLVEDLPTGGSLRQVRTDATPAPAVLDRFGKRMLTQQTINNIILDPTATGDVVGSVARLAKTIEPLAQLITPDVINRQLADAGNKPVTVVSVRESDMIALAGDPAAIPGVSISKEPKLVLLDRRLDSPVFDGVRDYWQAILDATSGWAVQGVAPGQAPVQLAGEQGPPGPDVTTNIDPNIQLDALDAVVEVAQPASILVMDAKTGQIRAAMRNDQAEISDIRIDKKYTPGATLGPVADVINRTAGSDDAKAKALLGPLGLGVDFTVAGVRPASATDEEPMVKPMTFRSEDLRVSALNMATLGVAVARGSSVAPSVIAGVAGQVQGGELGAVDPEVLAAVDGAMKATAADGDASDLVNAPGLRALVGTNGPQGPGWFVGIQGDRVFVVYCEGEKSGSAALAVAQRFLTPRPHPQ